MTMVDMQMPYDMHIRHSKEFGASQMNWVPFGLIATHPEQLCGLGSKVEFLDHSQHLASNTKPGWSAWLANQPANWANWASWASWLASWPGLIGPIGPTGGEPMAGWRGQARPAGPSDSRTDEL